MKKLNNQLILFAAMLFYCHCFSQSGANDPSFNSAGFTYGSSGAAAPAINSVAVQTDGKIVIGGTFTSYNGVPLGYIARLNADGSLDNSFNAAGSGFTGPVSVLIQPDGNILVAGGFSSYNGTSVNDIVRLFPNGSLDLSFNSGSGTAHQTIYTMALQSNGKVMIGGEFTSYNGTARNYIARLNADGSLDNTFNPGTGANHSVLALAVQNDGKIICGGNFTTYNGTARNHIARINANGTLDNTFTVGSGSDDAVYSTSIQSNNKIVISGFFTSYNGTSRNYVARLNTDGSLDVSFNTGTGANSYVYSTLLQPDGKVVLGGNFTSFNASPAGRIIRLNPNGSIDNTFNSGLGLDAFMICSSLQNDGKILVGGSFTQYDGVGRNCMTRIQNCINTFSTINDTACESYVLNNQTYQNSGTYTQLLTNAGGCDSTITLNLLIRHGSTSDVNAETCNSSYTLNGQTYNMSGNYTQLLTNAVGCDSVLTLHLLLKQSTISTLNVTECDSFSLNGETYTSSGIYTQNLVNSAGCDSTLTIHLTIDATPPASVINNGDGSLTATSGNWFQWIDCATNTAIPGATNVDFTPDQNGYYAVVTSTPGSLCMDTSMCVAMNNVSLNELETAHFELFPNPSTGDVTIQFALPSAKLVIRDAQGKEVNQLEIVSGQTIQIDELSRGIYLFELSSNEGIQIYRMMKE